MTTPRITLATLPQASRQEVFDQAARHLLTQGKKSLRVDGRSTCGYRSTAGALACGAGCFIADAEYRESMEGAAWISLAADGRVPRTHRALIGSIQTCHDNYYPSEWPNELRRVAQLYTLSAAVVDEFQPQAIRT